MKNKFLGLLLLVFSALQLHAQPKEKPNLPPFGIGIANGFTFGDLDGQKFNGYANQFRFLKVFNSYPPVFVGIDGAFARLRFKDDFLYTDSDDNRLSIQNLKANRYTLGVSTGFMIPLDLFIQSEKIPRGAGPLIIAGYNFLEKIDFDDFEETINGQGFKLGFQMPIPVTQKVILAFQVEYFKTFYKNTDELPVFLNANDLSTNGWNFAFQVGIPLGKKREE